MTPLGDWSVTPGSASSLERVADDATEADRMAPEHDEWIDARGGRQGSKSLPFQPSVGPLSDGCPRVPS
jgi:hypothetical protein